MENKKFYSCKLADYLEELDDIVAAQRIESSSNGDNTMTLPIYGFITHEELNYIRKHFLDLGYGVFFIQSMAITPYKPQMIPISMTLTWW